MLRLLRLMGVLAFILGATGACAADPSDSLLFTYRVFGEPDLIDQTLTIINTRVDQAAIPTLQIRPLDDKGKLLPDVSTEGLFGSLKGEVLIPPGSGYDILRFSGNGAAKVRDVDVKVLSVRWVPYPHRETLKPTLDCYGADGSQLTRFDDFTTIVVSNPNAFDIKIAIAYIVWTDPDLPPPQQAQATAMFPGPTKVLGKSGAMIKIGDGVQAVMAARPRPAAISVKANYVP